MGIVGGRRRNEGKCTPTNVWESDVSSFRTLPSQEIQYQVQLLKLEGVQSFSHRCSELRLSRNAQV